jgi:two-component system, NtrC family, nitrogen regulation sensor histidine kinase NtrY
VTAPVGLLTKGLAAVAAGDLSARVEGSPRSDEVGRAIAAFNDMAAQLQRSRENLIHVTRLSSWQALARKMAHEVKNSLTPIRLTMEEISARSAEPDPEFLRQASQIVVDEVISLERRMSGFLGACGRTAGVAGAGGPDRRGRGSDRVPATGACGGCVSDGAIAGRAGRSRSVERDRTNLIENAAQAARDGGVVLVRTGTGPAEPRDAGGSRFGSRP